MSIRSVAQASHLLMHGFICEVHANCCVHMRPSFVSISTRIDMDTCLRERG